MLRRGLATLLAFALAMWVATPSFTTVTCRPGFAHCSHCPKPKLDPVHANLKADCCVVHPALARAQATPPSARGELCAELPPALGSPVLGLGAAQRSVLRGDADPPPPPLQRLKPLLC